MNVQDVEIQDVAGDEREAMLFGRGCDEGVHRAYRTATGLSSRHDTASAVSGPGIDRQHARLKT